jgi:hypothetical protein
LLGMHRVGRLQPFPGQIQPILRVVLVGSHTSRRPRRMISS